MKKEIKESEKKIKKEKINEVEVKKTKTRKKTTKKDNDDNIIQKSIDFSLLEVIFIIAITVIVTSIATSVIVFNNRDKISNNNSSLSEDNFEQFKKSYNEIVNNYVDEVDENKLLDAAIAGMYSFLSDEYSIYMDNETTESLEEMLTGEYEGIGIEMTMNTSGEIYITQVFKDTAAYEAGLKENDVLVALDGKSLKGTTTSELANTIKKGTKKVFKLTYRRDGKEKTVTVTKRHVYIDSVKSKVYDNVGYINITTFSATTKDQVQKILSSFDKKVNSIIIDVRDNSGGYLKTAYNTSDLFIEKGKCIYQLKDRNGKIKKYYATSGVYKKYNNIVVLINENSASASEILALALKESANAKIVGTKSYGKGTVQETSTLKSGAMVKYTTAYWLSPKGNSINKLGIKPDIEVKDKDKQLDKALEVIK